MKLGTVAVLETGSQTTDFEFKRARVWVRVGDRVEVRVIVWGLELGIWSRRLSTSRESAYTL